MNHEFSCILVDDENHSVELLHKRLVQLYKHLNIIAKYSSWEDALNGLRTLKCDILFMDISMPGKNGMDLLSLLPDLDCEVIFVTAFEDYALSSFRFSPSGYVLKPIDDVDLVTAVDKAIERLEYKKAAKQHAHATISPANSKLGILSNTGIEYVDLNDILYLETIRGYTKVITLNGEILSSFSIGKFKTILDKNLFYQVHRSYIANINHIRRYKTTGEIVMKNDRELPVSRSLREDFVRLFNTVTGKSGEETG